MDAIHESGDRIEFRSNVSAATRALFLAGGLIPLLAPYELLIQPPWRSDSSPRWWFFLVISAGAVALTLFAIYAALFGLSQRVRFDSGSQLITHGFKAAVLRYRGKRYPLSAVESLHVRTHNWSDGPDTYNLVLKLKGAREIEFGRFIEQAEAERSLSALEGMIRRGGDAR